MSKYNDVDPKELFKNVVTAQDELKRAQENQAREMWALTQFLVENSYFDCLKVNLPRARRAIMK